MANYVCMHEAINYRWHILKNIFQNLSGINMLQTELPENLSNAGEELFFVDFEQHPKFDLGNKLRV